MELGCCSAILPQGVSSDLHNFAQIDGRWKQNEKWTQPADNHNITGQFDPTVHSTTGINGVSLPGYPRVPTDSRVIQTTQNFPDEFPFNLDINSGFHLGIGMYNSQDAGGLLADLESFQVGLNQRSAAVKEAALRLRIWDHNSSRARI